MITPVTPYHAKHYIAVDDDTRLTNDRIFSLDKADKIGIAIERILAGHNLYFTCGHAQAQSPFNLDILPGVREGIEKLGKKLNEKEAIDTGGSIYACDMSGYLDGIWVTLIE